MRKGKQILLELLFDERDGTATEEICVAIKFTRL